MNILVEENYITEILEANSILEDKETRLVWALRFITKLLDDKKDCDANYISKNLLLVHNLFLLDHDELDEYNSLGKSLDGLSSDEQSLLNNTLLSAI